jgi:hypothetical protein
MATVVARKQETGLAGGKDEAGGYRTCRHSLLRPYDQTFFLHTKTMTASAMPCVVFTVWTARSEKIEGNNDASPHRNL